MLTWLTPPDPLLKWTVFVLPDPDPCAVTVTESPANVVSPPAPADGAPGEPTEPVYVRPGVTARDGSSAYSPPLPPEPPAAPVPLPPAVPPAQFCTRHDTSVPGGSVTLNDPGFVNV